MADVKEKKFTVNSLKYYTQKNRDKNRELNDARYLKLEDKGALATKDEVAKTDLAAALKTEIEGKADSATTLSGYGIENAYTKDEVNAKISATYKPKGSLTAAELVAGLLVEANLGNVYNVSDELTTTADFLEGAGKTFPAGVNVAIVEATAADNSDPENPVAATYKFDVLAGMVDTSAFLTDANFETFTNEEIDGIFDEIADGSGSGSGE